MTWVEGSSRLMPVPSASLSSQKSSSPRALLGRGHAADDAVAAFEEALHLGQREVEVLEEPAARPVGDGVDDGGRGEGARSSGAAARRRRVRVLLARPFFADPEQDLGARLGGQVAEELEGGLDGDEGDSVVGVHVACVCWGGGGLLAGVAGAARKRPGRASASPRAAAVASAPRGRPRGPGSAQRGALGGRRNASTTYI